MENLSQYGRKWTRDETILALGLYFQIPFAKISSRNQEIRKLAQLMKRSPASLSMKMDNLGRFATMFGKEINAFVRTRVRTSSARSLIDCSSISKRLRWLRDF